MGWFTHWGCKTPDCCICDLSTKSKIFGWLLLVSHDYSFASLTCLHYCVAWKFSMLCLISRDGLWGEAGSDYKVRWDIWASLQRAMMLQPCSAPHCCLFKYYWQLLTWLSAWFLLMLCVHNGRRAWTAAWLLPTHPFSSPRKYFILMIASHVIKGVQLSQSREHAITLAVCLQSVQQIRQDFYESWESA